MRKLKYIFIAAMLVSVSCKKEETIVDPSFEVRTSASTYKVGDRINFDFSGNPDIISFYSGEVGNDYQYINGRLMPATSKISFISRILTAGQTGQLEVFASSDFNGIYTLDNVHNATWVNITNRFKYATGNVDVASEIGNVDDVVAKGKAIYVGFRYKTKAKQNAGNLLGARFRISNFSFLVGSTISSEERALTGGAGWTAVASDNYETNRVRVTSAYIEFLGNATNTAVDTEGWIITYPILFDGTLSYAPDKSKAVKSVGTQSVPNHTHIYNDPGIYNVVFTAANANVEGSKQTKKELKLTIVP